MNFKLKEKKIKNLKNGFFDQKIKYFFLFQIRFILLQNRQGKTRLAKWYVNYDENEKVKLQAEIHRMIVSRDSKHTNFLEVIMKLIENNH